VEETIFSPAHDWNRNVPEQLTARLSAASSEVGMPFVILV
jgi:hypothetical protein